MEAIVAAVLPYIPSAAIPVIIVVIAIAWIQSHRKEVGKKRYDFQVLTEYRLNLLETGQTDLKDSIKELQESIIQLQLSINTLIAEFKALEKYNNEQ